MSHAHVRRSVLFLTAGLAVAWNATAQVSQRVSVDSAGMSGGAGEASSRAAISSDGRYVAFASQARLAPGDTNAWSDVYVHDRISGVTLLASHASGGSANGPSSSPDLSSDGRYVVFQSQATNLVSNDADDTTEDVFVFDRVSGLVMLEDVTHLGTVCGDSCTAPRISGDGRFVIFDSAAATLVPGDTNGFRDVFLRDRQLSTIVRVSTSSSSTEGNGDSFAGDLSDDGGRVAFTSQATNFASGDVNSEQDVFVRDVGTGSTTLVSVSTGGVPANGRSAGVSISGNGVRVAFWSAASNLVVGDSNIFDDVFVRDLTAGTTVLVDRVVGSGTPSTMWNQPHSSLSTDGSRVVFAAQDRLDVSLDTNTEMDVYLRDLTTNQTILVSRGNGSGSFSYAKGGTTPAISGDGLHVASENANAYVPDDTNAALDVHVRDLANVYTTIGRHCTAGVTSHGCQATLNATGIPSASSPQGFWLTASSVEGQATGIVFFGVRGATSVPFGATSSTLCVRAPQERMLVQSAGGTSGACDGLLSVDWNAHVASYPGGLGQPFRGGETVWAQCWFRDAAAPGGSNLSDALWFTVGP